MNGTEQMKLDAGEISGFILSKLQQEEFIVQPYVNCRTKSGEPYDFRLHVQKGRKGEWVDPIIYPRINRGGGVVCNISRGGYTCEIDDFLEREFGTDSLDIKKQLEMFSLQLASHLDEIQMELYGEALDAIGIDVGMDENKKLYIYEVNWRPAPPFIKVDLRLIRKIQFNTLYF